MLHDHRRWGIGVEGDPAGEHLVEDYAQGVDVAAGIHRVALALLRGHVLGCAQEGPGAGDVRGGLHHPGDAEVGEEGAFVLGQEDVQGLHVPVHHPVSVGVVQGQGHLGDDARCPSWVHRPAQFLPQGAAGDVLHDDVGQATLFAVGVDREYIGVVQPGDGPGLSLEALAEALVVGVEGGQDLDGHVAVQGGVVALVDGGHAATAQFLQDPVPADLLAHGLSHGLPPCRVVGSLPNLFRVWCAALKASPMVRAGSEISGRRSTLPALLLAHHDTFPDSRRLHRHRQTPESLRKRYCRREGLHTSRFSLLRECTSLTCDPLTRGQ